MINVNPYEIQYTRITNTGVLAGIPCECKMGVPDAIKGREAFEAMVKNDTSSRYSNFQIIDRSGHVVKTI